MLHRTLTFAALALALAAAPAAADPNTAHLNAGFELLGGGGAFSAGGRIHAGVGQSFGDGRVQPAISVGGTLGAGSLSVSDPRALDGTVNLGVMSYGPEVTLALRFVRDGWVDNRLFVNAAWTRVDVDHRLMLDPVAGVHGGQGVRVGIGANWVDSLVHIEPEGKWGDSEKAATFLMPEQVEVVWERGAGSDRYGVALSWGI